jgi:hypothetical protein
LVELEELVKRVWLSRFSRSMTRLNLERAFLPHSKFLSLTDTNIHSLINVLKAANQPVPDELLKFGTTVKKKGHEVRFPVFCGSICGLKTQLHSPNTCCMASIHFLRQ